LRSRPDLSEFEQVEAEGFDLRKDAEQRGPILEQASEHGLAALQLRRHRGKGGQSGSSELTSYPDGVQARRCGHVISLQPDLVSLRRQDLVIVGATWLALLWGCFVTPGRKEPQLACAFNGARAIARAELGVDPADVRIDRVDGHVELPRDLGPRQIRR